MAEERPADLPKLENYTPTPLMLPTSHYDEKKADRAVNFIQQLCHDVMLRSKAPANQNNAIFWDLIEPNTQDMVFIPTE